MEEKIIDKEKLKTYIQITRITIVICWISLFAFWAIKLFCGNFFEIVVENENFVKFSEMVETTWLKYLVSFITMVFSNYFLFCAIKQSFTFKPKELLIYFVIILSMWTIVHFVNIESIKMCYGYFAIIIYGLIYQKKWKKLYGVLAVILQFIFSVVSMMTRNIELYLVYNYLISIILSIDIYIMYCLYYLYSNLLKLKKE
jgi:hypothetical protein